jgi:hypothetical protein
MQCLYYELVIPSIHRSVIIIPIDNNNNNNNKSFRKYVSSIPGNHEVRELQRTAILGTAHILWKVLT